MERGPCGSGLSEKEKKKKYIGCQTEKENITKRGSSCKTKCRGNQLYLSEKTERSGGTKKIDARGVVEGTRSLRILKNGRAGNKLPKRKRGRVGEKKTQPYIEKSRIQANLDL